VTDKALGPAHRANFATRPMPCLARNPMRTVVGTIRCDESGEPKSTDPTPAWS
jgi:hypothetical protein